MTLLDGGTKDYEEIEDEDEVKVDVFKKNTIYCYRWVSIRV